MAQFDADIKLKVAVENLQQSVSKVEKAFQKLQDYRVKVRIDGKAEVERLGNSFKRLGTLLKTSGVVTAVAAITGSLQSLNNLPIIGGGLNTTALGKVVSQLGALSNAAADAAAAHPGLAAGIAAATAATIAFAPQIGRAAKDTLKLARVAAEAQVPVENLFKQLGLSTLRKDLGGFGDAAQGVEVFRARIHELNESVSNLRSRASSLQSALSRFNSGSATAEKTAEKLVAVNARLNDELREQADLLRRVKGVNITELEATKGRKSIETSARAERFRQNQARENAAVQQSLERLEEAERAVNNARLDQRAERAAIQSEKQLRAENNATIKSLERRVQIEERIAKVRSSRIARQANERAAFLRGNPNQYGEGAVGPQSGAFAAQQAATKQAQQRFAIQSNITKALAGQRFQYQLQVALLQQAAKIGQQITASTREQEQIQLRLNRQLRVRRGRDLQARRKEAITNATIGGAFPLLFGQGAGASLGGGLGGGLGGLLGGQAGFAGSLVGTAIGQTFDNIVSSTAELGKALSIVNPDVEKITAALGVAGTQTEAYIKSLQSVGKESEAAAFAAAKLEELVGNAGVTALQQFGDETQELTNEFQKFFTQLQAGIAELLVKSGAFRSAAEGVGRAVDIDSAVKARGRNPQLDAALDALEEERRNPARGLEGAGIGALIPQGATEAELKVLEEYNKLLRESGEIIDANGLKQQEKAAELEKEVALARLRLEVERGNNDLLNLSVVDSLRAIAAEETRLELIAAQGDARAIELALLNASIKKLELDNKIAAAKARAASVGARAASKGANTAERAAQKEARVQKALAAEKLKQFDLDNKLAVISLEKEEQLKYELSRLDARTQIQRESILLGKEDERIQQEKLKTLDLQHLLRKEELDIAIAQLKLEKEMQKIRGKQELSGIKQSLFQEFQSLQLGSGNPIADAFNDQRNEQLNRYNNTLTSITDQLQIQQAYLEKGDAGQQAAAQVRIDQLREQERAYKQLLPAIFEAEKQQLAYNTALSYVQGPVNSLLSGFREVVSGTKSVEEAFADLLNGLADQLMQVAAQMIAQYIAIGIARKFAGMGDGGGIGDLSQGASVASLMGGFGSLPGRASGGPVTGGSPYMVGERGPELFVPNSSGTIVPNHAMGATTVNITVNENGRASANGDGKNGVALARMVESSTLAIITREKRPGGLLS